MNAQINKVANFAKMFEHPVGKLGTVEPRESRQLRIKLLLEEVAELAEASDCRATLRDWADKIVSDEKTIGVEDGDKVDIVEELDALSDIQYVLNGKYVSSGLFVVAERGFDLVHNNNMKKAHRSDVHAEETAVKNNLKNYRIVTKAEGVVILYNESGKLIKPHDHVKVSFKTLLDDKAMVKVTEELNEFLRVEAVRDDILNTLKENRLTLCLYPGQPNHLWGKQANREVFDDVVTGAITIAPTEKPYLKTVVPVLVFDQEI